MRTSPGLAGERSEPLSAPPAAPALQPALQSGLGGASLIERAFSPAPAPRLATLVPRDASGHVLPPFPLPAHPAPAAPQTLQPLVVRKADPESRARQAAARQPHGHTAETLTAAPVKVTRALSRRGFDAVVAAYPSLAQSGFLRLVIDIVLTGHPHELRIASKSGAVFHPSEGWVCSNIPIVLRDGLLRHELMVKTVTSRAIAESDVRERALPLYGRRRDALRPLDAFIWTLANTALERTPPQAAGNLRFRLKRFPNFTRLRPVPEAFYRLAIYSLRGTQSVQSLCRAFPDIEPDLVARFALCAVLSGLARVRQKPRPDAAAPGATRRSAAKAGAAQALKPSQDPALPDAGESADSELDDDAARASPSNGNKRSFFKAMIKRLF